MKETSRKKQVDGEPMYKQLLHPDGGFHISDNVYKCAQYPVQVAVSRTHKSLNEASHWIKFGW